LCAQLLLASRCVARVYSEELRDSGMEITQHTVLRLLEALGPMSQGELGERMAAEKTTVSRNVALLAKRGWVTVEAGADKRERVVGLSPAGRGRLRASAAGWERAQARARRALGGARFDGLRASLPEASAALLHA
jgi:DNA-binding MarR family transcriptional regulator